MTQQIIFFDLDGVIADFARGYKEFFGRNAYADDSFTINQVCLQDPHFFRKLKVVPEGMELLNQLRNKYKIVFLTTPMENMQYCKWDKISWLEENVGKEFDVIFAVDKSPYVIDEKSILIDDMDRNLKPWKDAGGTAILFPQKIDKILAIIEETLNPTKEIQKVKFQLKHIDTDTDPTPAQKESGNYRKGLIEYKGLRIRIENPKGSVRWGFDESGRKWLTKMKNHYGYIIGTEAADNDPIDVFIGDKIGASRAFVVNQGKNNLFDEHKIMLGFDNIEEAEAAYLSNYQKGWDGLISIRQTNTKKIREWIQSGNLNEPFGYKTEIKSLGE